MSGESSGEQILGITFFRGSASAAARRAINGPLVVAPSGTCFERFLQDEEYRRALLEADLVLPDSGLMVMLWKLLGHGSIPRISGLAYLKSLLEQPVMRGEVSWVLPNERSRTKLFAWAGRHNYAVEADDCYVAPIYGSRVRDEALLSLVREKGPPQIVIAIGAGAQEKLGLFLRENLASRPAIHCIGGALGFITGDQVAIPNWADRLYLGWFFRLVSQPRVFLPRLWRARLLPWLIFRYGTQLPPLRIS